MSYYLGRSVILSLFGAAALVATIVDWYLTERSKNTKTDIADIKTTFHNNAFSGDEKKSNDVQLVNMSTTNELPKEKSFNENNNNENVVETKIGVENGVSSKEIESSMESKEKTDINKSSVENKDLFTEKQSKYLEIGVNSPEPC